jgi:hypothetical protein
MHRTAFVRLTTALTLGALVVSHAPDALAGPTTLTLTVQQLEGKIRVEIDGELFTEYVWTGTPRPYMYPVIGPHNVPLTRNYPMQNVPGEEHDHPHHRSLWFGHGEVNDRDFWTEAFGTGSIIHEELLEASADGNRAVIRVRNRWERQFQVYCTDTRTITLRAFPDHRTIDYQITFHASEGPVHLGDTKEGAMGIRTHPNLRLTPAAFGEPEEVYGQAINSEGVGGVPIWGKRAMWVDYWGPIDTHMVGIAIFDAPTNPGYPTYWMARDYGLVAACPTGAYTFDPINNDPGAGERNVAEGESLTYLYRFLFHEGDYEEGRVAERYDEFVAEYAIHTAASDWLLYDDVERR